MENIKENIGNFLKSFEGKTIKDSKDVYNSLINYDRDVNKLARSCKLYNDLTLEQKNNYMYEDWDLKPDAPILSNNIDDHYKVEDCLLCYNNAINYIARSVLSGHTISFNDFVSQYFGDNKEFNNACLSDETLMEYLNKIQSIIDSNKDEFNYEKLPFYDQGKLNYFKTLIKFLKENKKVRDSILMVKQLSNKINKPNSKGREFSVTIDQIIIMVKATISNSMSGFIYANVYGNQLRKQNDGPIVKLYMTIKEDKIVDVMSDLGAFLSENDIRCFYKTRPYEANDMLTIRIDEIEKLDILVNWLKNNKNIYFSNHPFMPVVDGVAISLDEGGSYNKFISDTIYSYIKSTKDSLSYDGFVKFLTTDEYLNSLKKDEEKRFDNNLKIALTGEIGLNEFKDEYVKAVNDYKLSKEIKSAFNNFVRNISSIGQVYDDKTLLDVINASLDEIRVKYNFKDMNNESLLLSYYGKEKDDSASLIDQAYEVVASKGYTSAAERYYLGKILEKWNNLGGRKKIDEGLKAFRSISKTNGDYSNIPEEYVSDYKHLLEKIKRKNNIYIGSLEYALRQMILNASLQFGLERNPKDSKAYAIRKIYKKKKELQEND